LAVQRSKVHSDNSGTGRFGHAMTDGNVEQIWNAIQSTGLPGGLGAARQAPTHLEQRGARSGPGWWWCWWWLWRRCWRWCWWLRSWCWCWCCRRGRKSNRHILYLAPCSADIWCPQWCRHDTLFSAACTIHCGCEYAGVSQCARLMARNFELFKVTR
jgi:hypothetical protein